MNGDHGIVFSTESDFQPIAFAEIAAVRSDAERFPALHEVILDELPPTPHLEPAEARALLLALWLGPFVRPWSSAGPIGLFIGPPGCGKSVTQRAIAAAFYGVGEVGGGAALDRVSKDLLAGAVYQSLVVRDDVSDLPPGGIDALCRVATGTTAKLAVFQETLSLASYRARARLLLSAVRPSWLVRADLLSRIWLVEFDRPVRTSAITERDRIERVLAARPAIWAPERRPAPPRSSPSEDPVRGDCGRNRRVAPASRAPHVAPATFGTGVTGGGGGGGSREVTHG